MAENMERKREVSEEAARKLFRDNWSFEKVADVVIPPLTEEELRRICAEISDERRFTDF